MQRKCRIPEWSSRARIATATTNNGRAMVGRDGGAIAVLAVAGPPSLAVLATRRVPSFLPVAVGRSLAQIAHSMTPRKRPRSTRRLVSQRLSSAVAFGWFS